MPVAMNRRIRRSLSIFLLAMLGFAQASMVIAACSMDRANLAQMLAAAESHDCCDQSNACPDGSAVAMSATACMSQSTSDLQAFGVASLGVGAAATLVLFQVASSPPPSAHPPVVPRPAAVPRRILLHSFLI